LHDVISVSSGQRGLQLLLAPEEYLRAAEATIASLTRVTPQPGSLVQ
jgi:Cys-tRNA(Pro)/Cys-tRNA(Cys) deacylase